MYFDNSAQREQGEEWARLVDPSSGAAYWYNNFTGESVWAEDDPDSNLVDKSDSGFGNEEEAAVETEED